mmetsp:Transcript_5068/g.14269  ORF Transcript_5068/g.14269 Transcript_5068/m.14269 type:complete len:339 (-) Transcript_5068:2629-3645(-)
MFAFVFSSSLMCASSFAWASSTAFSAVWYSAFAWTLAASFCASSPCAFTSFRCRSCVPTAARIALSRRDAFASAACRFRSASAASSTARAFASRSIDAKSCVSQTRAAFSDCKAASSLPLAASTSRMWAWVMFTAAISCVALALQRPRAPPRSCLAASYTTAALVAAADACALLSKTRAARSWSARALSWARASCAADLLRRASWWCSSASAALALWAQSRCACCASTAASCAVSCATTSAVWLAAASAYRTPTASSSCSRCSTTARRRLSSSLCSMYISNSSSLASQCCRSCSRKNSVAPSSAAVLAPLATDRAAVASTTSALAISRTSLLLASFIL